MRTVVHLLDGTPNGVTKSFTGAAPFINFDDQVVELVDDFDTPLEDRFEFDEVVSVTFYTENE